MVEINRVDDKLHWFDLEPCDTPEFVSPYLILDERIAVIETGPACGHDRMLEALNAAGIEPAQVDWILPTHIHLDHAGGTGHLVAACPNARVLVHPKGLPHLVKPTLLWKGSVKVLGPVAQAYGPPRPIAPERVVEAFDGMVMDLGQTALRVLFTPGHASHHLCYHERRRGWLFSGDAAGLHYAALDAAVPVTPPPYRHDRQLVTLERMNQLSPRLLCYTHFGPRDDAKGRLKQAMSEYAGWMACAGDAVGSGIKIEDAYPLLLAQYPLAKAVQDINDTRFPQKDTIFNSLEGMMAYINQKS